MECSAPTQLQASGSARLEKSPREPKHALTADEQEAIMSMKGNEACFECHTLNPEWASVTFGITLCLACAGHHRGYGVHVSFVRSLLLDEWSDLEVRSMLLGGNATFRTFLGHYGCDGPSTASSSHCCKPAAALYRERLASLCSGRDPLELDSELPAVEDLEAAGASDSGSTQQKTGPGATSLAQVAPTWAKNSPECMICQKKFTALFRRHHCRRCGRCVCSRCAPPENTRPILEWGMKSARHCKDCYRSPVLKWHDG